MNKEQLKKKVIQIIKDEIRVDLSTVDPAKNLREQVSIDSLKCTEIYAALMDELQVKISASVFVEAETLEDLLNVLYAEVKKQHPSA